MSAFNSLQKIAKRNRKSALTIACFVLITAIEFSVTFVNKETKILNEISKVSSINRVKVAKIENEISTQGLQLQTIVTRLSFNAYIAHTDDRFKIISLTNEKLLQDIGTITGRVSGLEKIIYALNMYELRSARKDDIVCKNTPQEKEVKPAV